MFSFRNRVKTEVAVETIIHGNNGEGWDEGPASMVTWGDRNSSQGDRVFANNLRGRPDFPQQVQDEPWGQLLTEITFGERLPLVP